jgi:hypothetical protein
VVSLTWIGVVVLLVNVQMQVGQGRQQVNNAFVGD